jgi:hypothetical protein
LIHHDHGGCDGCYARVYVLPERGQPDLGKNSR